MISSSFVSLHFLFTSFFLFSRHFPRRCVTSKMADKARINTFMSRGRGRALSKCVHPLGQFFIKKIKQRHPLSPGRVCYAAPIQNTRWQWMKEGRKARWPLPVFTFSCRRQCPCLYPCEGLKGWTLLCQMNQGASFKVTRKEEEWVKTWRWVKDSCSFVLITIFKWPRC